MAIQLILARLHLKRKRVSDVGQVLLGGIASLQSMRSDVPSTPRVNEPCNSAATLHRKLPIPVINSFWAGLCLVLRCVIFFAQLLWPKPAILAAHAVLSLVAVFSTQRRTREAASLGYTSQSRKLVSQPLLRHCGAQQLSLSQGTAQFSCVTSDRP